jgi:hypothetical protein
MKGQRLISIEQRLDVIEADLKLAINYMREIALIIGARERLAAIDRELADVERRDTDPAPNGADAGE